VVTLDDPAVLQPQPERQLTMTTCWRLWADQFATRRPDVFESSA